jgi:hypothetical protein
VASSPVPARADRKRRRVVWREGVSVTTVDARVTERGLP